MLLQLIQIILVGSVSSVLAKSGNSYYFAFPALYGTVPTIHVGDLVNVTWFSNFDQSILQLFCGSNSVPVSQIHGLGGDGQILYSVNSSWTSPCHWRMRLQSDSGNWFNSGTINVSNVEAIPATTWQPSDVVPTVCPGSTPSDAVPTTCPAPTSTSVPTATPGDSSNKQALSTGASMGVGVVIGTALSGVAAAAWFALCIRRRRRGERETKVVGPLHGHQAYYGDQHQQQALQNFQELHPFVIAEVDGDNGPRRDSNIAEMPSDPSQPNPTTRQ